MFAKFFSYSQKFSAFKSVGQRYIRTKATEKISKLSRKELETELMSCTKPKSKKSAFNLFVAEYSKQIKRNDDPIPLSEYMKRCAEKWKSLSVDDRYKYEKQLRQLRGDELNVGNYRALMDKYVKVGDAIAVFNSLLKKAQSERKSLKTVSSFNLFTQEQLNDKSVSLSDATKRWNSVDERTKKEYEQKAEKMNADTKKALQDWKEKYSFFN